MAKKMTAIAWTAAEVLCAVCLVWVNLALTNIGNIVGTLLFGGLFCAALFRKRLGAAIKRFWGQFPGKAALTALAALVLFLAGLSVFFGVNMAHYADNAVDPAERTDCVLVLGCRVVGETPSRMLTERLDAALDILNAEPQAVCVVSGGKGSDEQLSEAEAMRRYLIDRGISEERIITEDKAVSTAENFRYSAEVLRGLGIESNITVVTSDFHQYRAHIYAEREGLSVSHRSARTGLWALPNYVIREICLLAAVSVGC
ncbi:MAG: YdcF family protein [Oscillospiraceae bacterium]